MQIKVTILIALFTLVVVGCAYSPGGTTSAGACAAPYYGIITDENFQVVDLVPNGAAAMGGMQVGDVLLDLTWVNMEPQPPCNDTISLDANGSPIIIFPPPIQVPLPEPEHPTGAVPFAAERIEDLHNMSFSGATLKFRIKRGDQELELNIKAGWPDVGNSPPDAPTPTVIPATPVHYFF